MARSLTSQQEYLLSRLPQKYKLKLKTLPEPVAVTKARKIVDDFVEAQRTAVKTQEELFDSYITEAREAIYFKPSGEALVAVRKAEEKLAKIIRND